MKRWKWILLTSIGLPLLLLLGLYAWGGRTQTYKASIEIAAPPADVFPYLIKPELVTQWVHGVKEMKPLTPGGHKVGAKAQVVVEEEGTKYEFIDEVTESVTDQSIAVLSEGDIFQARNRWVLSPVEGGTQLEVVMQADFRGFFRLLAPMMEAQAQTQLQADFERLKRLIESNNAEPAPVREMPPEAIDNLPEETPPEPSPQRETSETDDWMTT